MKKKLIFMLFVFFQTFLFGQTTSKIIDVKVITKNFDVFRENPYGFEFDTDGKLLKRIGYGIYIAPNEEPTDLVETHIYSDEGLLKNILVQEKDRNNNFKVRFQSKYFYNEKKQLTEMINFNFLLDSIQQKITFEYDNNGNRNRININKVDYIVNKFDSSNKYVESYLFKNNVFVKNVTISDDSIFTYRDLPEAKSNRQFISLTYLRSKMEVGKEYETKTEFSYYKNGIIKKKKYLVDYNNNDSFELDYEYNINCDGKTKFSKLVVQRINKEILEISMWQ